MLDTVTHRPSKPVSGLVTALGMVNLPDRCKILGQARHRVRGIFAMEPSTTKPLQLSLFPSHIRLTHSVPAANRHRFYVLRTLPSVFGDCVLLREWGRIGSPGRLRCDRHPSESEAINALTKLARQKHRRGYALQDTQ